MHRFSPAGRSNDDNIIPVVFRGGPPEKIKINELLQLKKKLVVVEVDDGVLLLQIFDMGRW